MTSSEHYLDLLRQMGRVIDAPDWYDDWNRLLIQILALLPLLHPDDERKGYWEMKRMYQKRIGGTSP
jgi:hypothetical protein